MNMQEWCATPFITTLIEINKDQEDTHPDRFHYYLTILHQYYERYRNKWLFNPEEMYKMPINAFAWDDAEDILDLNRDYFYSIHQWLEYGQVPKDWNGEKWVDTEMP